MTKEVLSSELKVGMVITAKIGATRFRILRIQRGYSEYQPYLIMVNLKTNVAVDHDTSLDRYDSTYTVDV